MDELEEIIEIKRRVALAMGLLKRGDKVRAMDNLVNVYRVLSEKELVAIHSVEKELRQECCEAEEAKLECAAKSACPPLRRTYYETCAQD